MPWQGACDIAASRLCRVILGEVLGGYETMKAEKPIRTRQLSPHDEQKRINWLEKQLAEKDKHLKDSINNYNKIIAEKDKEIEKWISEVEKLHDDIQKLEKENNSKMANIGNGMKVANLSQDEWELMQFYHKTKMERLKTAVSELKEDLLARLKDKELSYSEDSYVIRPLKAQLEILEKVLELIKKNEGGSDHLLSKNQGED
jgi:uncharacterized coiled-coil protein SlyX